MIDGFGFGTLTGESCLKNVHCRTDRASWDVTVVAFGALMWKTCAQSHRFGLGRVGGGGDTIGGGGVGEPFAFCCYAGIGLAGIVAIRPVAAEVMISSSGSASRSFALSLGLHALSLVNHAMPNSNLY